MNRIAQVLAELHAAIDGKLPLVLAGGYGLYLKQQRLLDTDERTLFPRKDWPIPRTTEDIDLLLHAEVATDSSRMSELRGALDSMGFEPIDTGRYYQFVRNDEYGMVKIDLLAGPLGKHESRVRSDPRRVRPRPSVNLHARRTPEAIGVEEESISITVEEANGVEVLIPNALTFVLMKLGALSDRANDEEKDFGRHHALDLYRCVAMLTPGEDESASRIRDRHAGHEATQTGLEQVEALFGTAESIGRIRLLEHSLLPEAADVDRFVVELRHLVVGSTQKGGHGR